MQQNRQTELLIKELEEKYGEERTSMLVEYMDMILEKNQHINLTAVRDRDEALQKHIADSLSCDFMEEYEAAENVIDVGTGAGFPGVPLAIVSPDKKFTLVDSLNKRLRIIDELTGELGIKNVTTVHGRAEDVGKSKEHREQYDICVSRAVASLDVLCEWCLPLVKKGGYFVAYKGENVSRETEDAAKAIRLLGGKITEIRKVQTEEESISGHVLVMIKKVKNTPSKYPRQAGQARKNPLR
ncbi:MAG: 16S rRNA (guanine(527)-N(7))-methyltransferase RsmG [Anaerovoracaceae bacterium]